jgi:hypothetical protein
MEKPLVESRHMNEMMVKLERMILGFGSHHSRGGRNEDVVIALVLLKSLVSLLLASMAKVIGLDRQALLSEFTEEIKDQYQIFDDLETSQKNKMN